MIDRIIAPTVRTPLPVVDPHIDRIYVLTMRTPGLRKDDWFSHFAAIEAEQLYAGMSAADIERAMSGDDSSDGAGIQ